MQTLFPSELYNHDILIWTNDSNTLSKFEVGMCNKNSTNM